VGGRKHHLQGFGLQPGDYEFNKIKDPIERDLSFNSMNLSQHCKKCGNLILPPAKEERREYELEIKSGMHEDCMREVEADLKAKQRAEQAKKEKEAKEFDWDDYIKKHFENKEG
jgi:hypothetical protein